MSPLGKTVPALEPAFLELRELFHGPLRSAAFPGVDASTVASLVGEAERLEASVNAARAQLELAAAELAAAETAFAQHRATLARSAHTALAYARVFAKDDRELCAAIDRIVLPKLRLPSSNPSPNASSTPAASGAPRKRGRPPKSVSAPAPSQSPPEDVVVAAE